MQPDHLRDHNTFDPQDETGPNSERPFILQVPNILLSPPTEYPTTTPTRRSPIQFHQVYYYNLRSDCCEGLFKGSAQVSTTNNDTQRAN